MREPKPVVVDIDIVRAVVGIYGYDALQLEWKKADCHIPYQDMNYFELAIQPKFRPEMFFASDRTEVPESYTIPRVRMNIYREPKNNYRAYAVGRHEDTIYVTDWF